MNTGFDMRRMPMRRPPMEPPNGSMIQRYPPQYPPNYPPQYGQPPRSYKKWFFIGGFLVLVVLVLLFFFMGGKKISAEDLVSGTNVDLGKDKSVKMEIKDEEHKLTVEFVNTDSVDIIVESSPQRGRILLNEEEKFDIDSDNIYDLKVKLEGISEGKANLNLKKISEALCSENWGCTNWTRCLNGTQSRLCTDSNRCRTTDNKPSEVQSCTTVPTCQQGDGCLNTCTLGDLDCTCTEQNGTICATNQGCSASVINSSNSNKCCIGECVDTNPIGFTEICLSFDGPCFNMTDFYQVYPGCCNLNATVNVSGTIYPECNLVLNYTDTITNCSNIPCPNCTIGVQECMSTQWDGSYASYCGDCILDSSCSGNYTCQEHLCS
ncbi:MAG: hypothetical protein KKB31_00875 [Nanoarchaeota archaeon]|nr:hypothetical protein [Nanoarchaeota archaeon]